MTEKKIRYLLVSGIGYKSLVGANDPVLRKARPVKIWPHPFRLEEPGKGQVFDFLKQRYHDIQDFKLYDLKEILAK